MHVLLYASSSLKYSCFVYMEKIIFLSQTCENNPTSNSAHHSDSDQLHFMFLMKDAITNTSTDKLWKKYAKPCSMQFKQNGLESKVCCKEYDFKCMLFFYITVSKTKISRPSIFFHCSSFNSMPVLFYSSDHTTAHKNFNTFLFYIEHSIYFFAYSYISY